MGISKDNLYHLLQGCLKTKDLAAGRRVHSLMVSSGLQSVTVLGDHLIRLFALCGSLQDAKSVFCHIAKPTIYTWQAIITAHAMLGENERAILLYLQMQDDGIRPCNFFFSCILKVCGSIGAVGQGKLIHEHIVKSGLETGTIVGSAIVSMYAKCGCMDEAHMVFNTVLIRDVIVWNAIIAGYTQHGQSLPALKLFVSMQQEGKTPSEVTYLCILKACGSIQAIMQGRLIHEQIIRHELESNLVIGGTIIDMYSKCGNLEEALKVFDELPNQRLASWNAMLTGFVQHGLGLCALDLFENMHQNGLKPDEVTYSLMLQVCGDTVKGRLIHGQLIRVGLESDLITGNTLIDMYVKCGTIEEAWIVFLYLPNRDAVSWGAMIGGFAQHGDGLSALELFMGMQQVGLKPGHVTFLCILKACSVIGVITLGRLVNEQIAKSGLDSDEIIGSTLVATYAKCGSLAEAQKVFDRLIKKDEASWSSMIAGYAQVGQSPLALDLFGKMQQEGRKPSKVTFLCILKACRTPEAIWHGRHIHGQIIISELQSDVVIGSTLIDMYTKCGSLAEARKVFDELPHRNVITCNALMAGYIQNRNGGLTALVLFKEMIEEGLKPDKVTFLCILKVCSSIGAVGVGKVIHEQILRGGLPLDVIIGTALVGMYITCGNLDEAHKVFDELPYQNVVLWNCMIAGHAEHGNYRQAGQCLEKMQLQGLRPDGRTYTSILAACGHASQMDKGCQYFKSMREDHGICPSFEHLSCMVDLLGHTGYLNVAKELLQSIPASPDISLWKSLLTACRIHGDMELGRQCFNEAFRLNPYDAGGYVLMSNIYGDSHMWEDARCIQQLRKCAGAWKEPGSAWIETNTMTHNFMVGDKTHSQTDKVYSKLKRLQWTLNEEGYVPWMDT